MIWDKLSPFYDFAESIYNGKVFRGIAEEIKNYVGADDTVLECACGTGLLSVPMAEKCKSLTATDYSDGMLRQAKKKLKGFSNVKLDKVSIFELPYKNGSFDVVVAANVIHLLDKPQTALNELKRVCKPNGKIIIPTYINKQKKNSTIAANLLAKIGVDFKRQFDLEEYKNFFASFGFADVSYKVVEGRMPCAFAIIRNLNKRMKQNEEN